MSSIDLLQSQVLSFDQLRITWYERIKLNLFILVSLKEKISVNKLSVI